jgi:enoyl-CoA hydratase
VRFPELTEALCGAASVDALLGAFAQSAEEGPVAAQRSAIDALYKHNRVEDILAALDHEVATDGPHAGFASATAALIRTKSPTSLKIAITQMRRGPSLDFNECMRTEFRIVSRVVRGHDFYEGIRAVIVDKDQTPRWQPPALEAVSETAVEDYFAPVADELELQ